METDPREQLVPVEIQGIDGETGRKKRVTVAMRRVSEAKLWDRIARTPDHEKAAGMIFAAWSILDRGMGLQQSVLAKRMMEAAGGLPGKPFDREMAAKMLGDYFRWGSECTRRKISHAAIMDVLGYGKSCRDVDQDRRKRKGWAMRQISDGLGLYCDLLGWR